MGAAVFLGALLLMLSPMSQAISFQKKLRPAPPNPIAIRSEHFHVHGSKGKPSDEVFSGDVTLHQGDITIHAARARMQLSPSGNLLHARAWGTPAHFMQKPPQGPVTTGTAHEIVYEADHNTYLLIGGATLSRGTEHVKAHQIVYDVTTATINASQKPGGKRVYIVIPAKHHPHR
ncbi:Cell envelope biogenesis YhbN [mine drainage metagenome]|uniref:Cell envelope biogenesis YhbN n=1 Tax=mine drainage metagenome TaxID=410659 RepID=T1BUL3_9ZZZZ